MSDNVLTTPMVKKAMARNHLKEKNKQRRILAGSNGASTSAASAAKFIKSQNNNEQLKVKTESSHKVNPLYFLNINYPTEHESNGNNANQKDPQIFLPDKEHSLTNDANSEMYNASDFFNTDMPSDLFEVNFDLLVYMLT